MTKCKICGRSLFYAPYIVTHIDGTVLCSNKFYTRYTIKYRHEKNRKNEEAIKKKYGDLFLSIVDEINSFKPLLSGYENELSYHIDLARWLQPKFPKLQVELQRGSSRPDIVIEDIAIEIKGPTYEEGLQSIAR